MACKYPMPDPVSRQIADQRVLRTRARMSDRHAHKLVIAIIVYVAIVTRDAVRCLWACFKAPIVDVLTALPLC